MHILEVQGALDFASFEVLRLHEPSVAMHAEAHSAHSARPSCPLLLHACRRLTSLALAQLSHLQLILSSYRGVLEVHRPGTWQHFIAGIRGAAVRQQSAAVQSRGREGYVGAMRAQTREGTLRVSTRRVGRRLSNVMWSEMRAR